MINSKGNTKKVLLVGWFSFEQMGATAGDLLARDVAVQWLEEAGRQVGVATAPPFEGGIDWRSAPPDDYSHVVFVCGPFGNGDPLLDFMERFSTCKLVGLDISMLQPVEEWNPFAALVERDSTRRANPDISFAAESKKCPVVGVILVHPQKEYGARGRHNDVHSAIHRMIARRGFATIDIDTRIDENRHGLTTSEQVESLISCCDAAVTTRLHGLVLSLKNGVAPLVVDPIEGGAKISSQARLLRWPHLLTTKTVSDEALDHMIDLCLSDSALIEVTRCRELALEKLGAVRQEFTDAVTPDVVFRGTE